MPGYRRTNKNVKRRLKASSTPSTTPWKQAHTRSPGGVFVDEHASGARLDRPALDRLRDLAAEGVFEAVLVWSPDRLARRYAYQVVLLEELTRCGCEVVFVHHPFGHSPEEQMLLQIQGVFAEYERALIQDRTRRGSLPRAKGGSTGQPALWLYVYP